MTTRRKRERQELLAQYYDETKEIIILTADYKNRLWDNACDLIAWMEDGELHNHHGWFRWLDDKWASSFLPLNAYRLRVRQHKDFASSFLLLDVLQKDVTHPALQAVCEAWLRPTVWQEAPFPAFILNKRTSNFEADIDWLGAPIHVSLEQEADHETPPDAVIATLRKLYAAPEQWQTRLKNWACDELLSEAQTWQKKNKAPLSAEAFRQRLRLQEIYCYGDGSFSACFDSDGIFAKLVTFVEVNPDDSLKEVGITE